MPTRISIIGSKPSRYDTPNPRRAQQEVGFALSSTTVGLGWCIFAFAENAKTEIAPFSTHTADTLTPLCLSRAEIRSVVASPTYPFLLSFGVAPLLVANLRQVFAVFGDVLLVFDQLAPELLLQVDALVAGLRQAVDGVHDEVEAVQLVQHRHVKERGDGALFLVAADVDVVVVGAATSSSWWTRLNPVSAP
jgi:hypothetical protein